LEGFVLEKFTGNLERKEIKEGKAYRCSKKSINEKMEVCRNGNMRGVGGNTA